MNEKLQNLIALQQARIGKLNLIKSVESKNQQPSLSLNRKHSGWGLKEAENKRPKSVLKFPSNARNAPVRNKSMVNPY